MYNDACQIVTTLGKINLGDAQNPAQADLCSNCDSTSQDNEEHLYRDEDVNYIERNIFLV